MYQKIAESIIKNILDEKYTDKLPTEKELGEKYHVSRHTVRKALDIVFTHGMIKRVRGSGYYVIKRPLKSKKVLNLSLIFEKNDDYSENALKSKVIKFDIIHANNELAQRGNIDEGTEIYRLIRLRYFKGQLYDLEESYFPRSVVPLLTEKSVYGSVFNFLYDTYKIVGETSEDYIQIGNVSEYYTNLLKKDKNEKVLYLDAINYLSGGVVFNFSRTFFADDDLILYYHTKNIGLNN
ncbi:GntR family transcriptional regulator [Lactobacillus sp. ESL0791]|uniref:GntR family transcriptional regulator n=1 Tax=Lactobacillus sp. ESL0791 TaxID=2983234 RepID=UPI0023F74C5B|nr:GntR family transcriptional regulator [Lactobacillus sp. ESL0791]MDF7638312.1 GntR family transcriptional regulator [Lactobacillus sp. ESL0791]